VDAPAAVDAAARLVADGADIIELGAESTHPDARDVPADEEIRRLVPVIEPLVARGIRVCVDCYKPAVIRRALQAGAEMINDVTALRDDEAAAALRNGRSTIVLMHSRSATARAEGDRGSAGKRAALTPANAVDGIIAFFRERIARLEAAGIARERLVLDPGMGMFLGPDPAVSLAVLREIARLRAALRLPVMISTSRKSFIGALLNRPVGQRAAGTLATELWAWRAGADYIRTHDVRQLADAVRVSAAIESGSGDYNGGRAIGGRDVQSNDRNV
jgi:dihydropteroate synthase